MLPLGVSMAIYFDPHTDAPPLRVGCPVSEGFKDRQSRHRLVLS
jgi:hypothetical protein